MSYACLACLLCLGYALPVSYACLMCLPALTLTRETRPPHIEGVGRGNAPKNMRY